MGVCLPGDAGTVGEGDVEVGFEPVDDSIADTSPGTGSGAWAGEGEELGVVIREDEVEEDRAGDVDEDGDGTVPTG